VRRADAAGHGRIGLYVNNDNLRALNSYFDSGFRLKGLDGSQYYMERS